MLDEVNTKDHIDTGQDMSRQDIDFSKYTLSAEEASRLFFNAGVPRSPRTIDRYCKSGHLVCTKIDTERNEKYLITRDSVTARITELQQVVVSGHVQTQRDMSRHVESKPDMSRHVATHDEITDEEKKELEAKIKELELENLDLKITNRGKDYFVEELKQERERFETVRKEMTQQLITQSQRMGELQVKVHQLEAPRQEEPNPSTQQNNIIDVTPENSNREEVEKDSNNVMQ